MASAVRTAVADTMRRHRGQRRDQSVRRIEDQSVWSLYDSSIIRIMIAETIAAVSALMQAIDFYEEHGGPGGSVITQLNLRYQPNEYREAEERIKRSEPGQADFYDRVFEKIKEMADRCRDRLIEVADDEDLLPQERRRVGKAGRLCICRALQLFRDFAPGKPLPPELDKLWQMSRCATTLGDENAGRSDVGNWGGRNEGSTY